MILRNILLVGLGGGLGSIARYCCNRWINHTWPHTFPWGHFVVNCVGCLLIGLFWGVSFRSYAANEQWKLFLMTGICGGFTTFSAFTLEGIGLLKEDRMGTFFLYVGGSMIMGLTLTYLGMIITKEF